MQVEVVETRVLSNDVELVLRFDKDKELRVLVPRGDTGFHTWVFSHGEPFGLNLVTEGHYY